MLTWRAMTPGDLAAVDAIALRLHPSYPEDREVFAERLRLHPGGCGVLAAQGDEIAGYVISHPWHLGEPPALNVVLGQLPSPATTYYIHDLALLPEARGTGAAGRIVAQLRLHARELGLPSLSLVAVNRSVPFWEKQGFAIAPGDGDVSSYGGDARLMIRGVG
ncbi:GNAT family N-acetyltransferase [Bradyrhizobium aeschynomenes]|uniref:GNAT family N-acetyltransferase n=1 Tax=Bradyrhizobium aeschynomenes TaxID=2734909 RepID=UPI001FEE248B|nr:GNAT family N-acetyltransferase [Bradyrhizobium aeschynomenes]